jgi:hypothetical protein
MARDKNLRPCLPLKPQEKKVYINKFILIFKYKSLIENWIIKKDFGEANARKALNKIGVD